MTRSPSLPYIHKILRNRIYSGDFDFDGTTYHGTYEAIVSRELWDQVQAILDGRGTKKTRKMKEQFAFSGLITCGHCGCAMVGEIKNRGRHPIAGISPHGTCPVRKSAAGGETQTPEFCTLELHLERRRVDRELSATR